MLLAFILLPVLAYCSVLLLFTVDIPKHDGYGDSLRTINSMHEADNLKEKWQILFKQHAEHRTLFSRMVYLLSLKTLGKLDYSAFIYIGNLSIFLLACIYLVCLAKKQSNWLFAIPLVYLLFQPSAYRSMFWAMAALSNYVVMLWAMLSIYFLHRRTYFSLFLSLAFAAVATFTQVNGLLTLPLGAAFLLLSALSQGDKNAKGHLMLWLFVSVLIAGFFFSDYEFRSLSKLPVNAAGIEAQFALNTSWLVTIHWFLALLGSPAAFGNTSIASIIGGGLTVLSAVFVLKGLYRKYPVISLYLLFAFASVLMTAIGRSFFLGVEFSQSPRYTFYSSQIIALLAALSVLELSQSKGVWQKPLIKIIVIVSITISLAVYSVNLEKIRRQQFAALRGMWLWNSKQQDRLLAPLVTNPGAILKKSQDLDFYQPPAISYLPPKQWGYFARELALFPPKSNP